VDGGDVNDRPEALRVHPRQRGADQQERHLDHELLDPAEVLRAEVLDGTDRLDAGVVHEDVRVEREVLEGCRVEQVDRPGLPLQLLREGRSAPPIAIDDHMGPAGSEGPRAGRADAARPSGDHRPPAGKAARLLLEGLGTVVLQDRGAPQPLHRGSWLFPVGGWRGSSPHSS
jgi:hypothetical protein